MSTKRIFYCCVFSLVFLALIGSAEGQNAPSTPTDFRINPDKPFAYLELEHIGSREPLIIGEPRTGIWFRFRNNSRLPLVVGKVSDPGRNQTVGLVDEVVPNSIIILSAGRVLQTAPDTPQSSGVTDLFQFPNEEEEAVRAAEWNEQLRLKSGKMSGPPIRPNGYGWQGLAILTIIPPGGELSFSLPIDHVSKMWHIEIPFRLALDNDGSERPPYSYLAFFWDDLPEVYRKAAVGPGHEVLSPPK